MSYNKKSIFLCFLIDFIALLLSCFAVWFYHSHSIYYPANVFDKLMPLMSLVLIVVSLIIYSMFHFYSIDLPKNNWSNKIIFIKANLLVLAISAILLFVFRKSIFFIIPETALINFFLINSGIGCIIRMSLR